MGGWADGQAVVAAVHLLPPFVKAAAVQQTFGFQDGDHFQKFFGVERSPQTGGMRGNFQQGFPAVEGKEMIDNIGRKLNRGVGISVVIVQHHDARHYLEAFQIVPERRQRSRFSEVQIGSRNKVRRCGAHAPQRPEVNNGRRKFEAVRDSHLLLPRSCAIRGERATGIRVAGSCLDFFCRRCRR